MVSASGCHGNTMLVVMATQCTVVAKVTHWHSALVAMVTYSRNDPLCLVLSLLEWREGGAGGLVGLWEGGRDGGKEEGGTEGKKREGRRERRGREVKRLHI